MTKSNTLTICNLLPTMLHLLLRYGVSLLYAYTMTKGYILDIPFVATFLHLLESCWNHWKRYVYQIKTFPESPRWSNISFIIKKHETLLFEDTYKHLSPKDTGLAPELGSFHIPLLATSSTSSEGFTYEETYPLYLSPYPVVSEVLLVYKQDEDHYRYIIVDSFLDLLKSPPKIQWINMVESKVEILSVEYSNTLEGIQNIEIFIPNHDKMVGNVLLSMSYIMRYFSYHYGTYYSIKNNYQVSVMILNGMDIQTFILDSKCALLLQEDTCKVVKQII